MKPNEPIVEFLCREENLPFAMDVAETFDQVYSAIERRFVNLMRGKVKRNLADWPSAGEWICEDSCPPAKGNRYASVYLRPARPAATCPYFVLSACRESGDYYLYYAHRVDRWVR